MIEYIEYLQNPLYILCALIGLVTLTTLFFNGNKKKNIPLITPEDYPNEEVLEEPSNNNKIPNRLIHYALEKEKITLKKEHEELDERSRKLIDLEEKLDDKKRKQELDYKEDMAEIRREEENLNRKIEKIKNLKELIDNRIDRAKLNEGFNRLNHEKRLRGY